MNAPRPQFKPQLRLGDDPRAVLLARAWRSALRTLANNVNRATFEGYIRPIQPRAWEHGEVTLAVQSAFAREWLQGRYAQEIRSALEAELANRVTLRFVVEPPPAAEPPARAGLRLLVDEAGSEAHEQPPERAPRRTQGAPDWLAQLELDERMTCERFVASPLSRMAVSAGAEVAESPGTRFNPLYLYGPSGVGKTHLLHAIALRARELSQDLRIGYLDAESFTYRYMASSNAERGRAFRELCDGVDFWLVDDAQFIAEREQARDELAHTLKELTRTGRQVVLAADRAPRELGLEERVTSRLEAGLVVNIGPPEMEARLALVEREARESGVTLPGELAYFIANGIRTNVRSLTGAVTRLLAYCRAMGAPLTVDVAAEALAPCLVDAPLRGWMRKGLSMEAIFSAVAEQFGVTLEALRGPHLDQRTVRARQAAMYLCRQFTGQTYTRIGEALGGRDHATVKRGAERIESHLETDHRLRAEVTQAVERMSR